VRDHTARGAVHRARWRLDHHKQPVALMEDLEDMEPVESDEQVTARTVGRARERAGG
jgi:hypothetical protein